MTKLLIKLFIQDSENTSDTSVRLAYGMLSGIVGILSNIFLFILKVLIGLTVNSISIISDGFNNLSDSLSSIITLLGYKMAAKPADEEHPFGHGRMEYIVSFIVSNIIFVVAFELLTSSLDKIFHPEQVHFSWLSFFILLASISLKLWLSAFNHTLGTKTSNLAMIAVSEDARNDVIATLATVFALLLSKVNPQIPFDGIAGLLVSLFIFYSGYGIAKEIINKLLGNPISQSTSKEIEALILQHPEITGVHDLIIHDYGPGRQFGSAHAEVDAHMDFTKAHDIIDEAEREIQDKMHIMMTLHLDPIELHNPEVNAYREEIEKTLLSLDKNLSMHDFRVVDGPSHTNLVFDVLIPYSSTISKETIKQTIDQSLQHHDKKIYTVITFDRDYIASKESSNE